MTRARPLTAAQREALLKAGWTPDSNTGRWWSPTQYVRIVNFSYPAREALREMARRAKRAKGGV
jgi:hypothetical protein